MEISFILSVAQVIIAVLLITAILLQQRGSGLGSAFGGGGGAAYTARRGGEKTLFQASIALGALFVGTAILQIIL